MGFIKNIINTWVTPADDEVTGRISLVTPDGKTTIDAQLTTNADARKIKEVMDILFPDIKVEEYMTLGRTE